MQYEYKLNGRVITIKANKSQAEAIVEPFKNLVDIRRHFKELSGVVGQRESSAVLWSPFGPANPVADEPGYAKDLETLLASLPNPLTAENCGPFIKQARELFEKHLPVVDKRRTLADETVRQAEVTVHEAQREAERAEWQQIYCQDKPVGVPEGQMAVYLEMSFDDSDSQTDYFCPHSQIGADMLLAIVPKQAERESLARRILALYPELAKLSWTWHTENYSMGHGNYLISEYTDHEENHRGYDGREKVHTRWEIRMNAYQREMLAYREYPGTKTQAPQTPTQPDDVIRHFVIRHNEERNGIEIQFPSKPSQETLEKLKQLGFRWSKFQGLWYTTYSESLFNQVQQTLFLLITGEANETPSV